MTITATQFPAPPTRAPSGAVSWRELSGSLWVARRDGRHIGTVQRGRRWLAADADSEPIGMFRTFAEAQAAVVGPPVAPPNAPSAMVRAPALVIAGLVLTALASAAAWTWFSLLL